MDNYKKIKIKEEIPEIEQVETFINMEDIKIEEEEFLYQEEEEEVQEIEEEEEEVQEIIERDEIELEPEIIKFEEIDLEEEEEDPLYIEGMENEYSSDGFSTNLISYPHVVSDDSPTRSSFRKTGLIKCKISFGRIDNLYAAEYVSQGKTKANTTQKRSNKKKSNNFFLQSNAEAKSLENICNNEGLQIIPIFHCKSTSNSKKKLITNSELNNHVSLSDTLGRIVVPNLSSKVKICKRSLLRDCKISFNSKGEKVLLIPPNLEKPLNGKICNKSSKHKKKSNGNDSPGTKLPPFTCEMCKNSFTTQDEIRQQMSFLPDQHLFVCKNCEQLCSTIAGLNSDVILEDRFVTCEPCNKIFRSKNVLRKHIVCHSDEKPFPCILCEKAFRSNSKLKQHMLYHSDLRPFVCELCKKGFRRNDNLKEHMLCHSKEKLYVCPICKAPCRNRSYLKVHTATHTNERPFVCEICKGSFKTNAELKQHSIFHSEEKPFACDICNKVFSRKGNLKIHKLCHSEEKPFPCEICEKPFKSKHELKQHMISHSSERPIICEKCGKTYKNMVGLRLHISSYHSDE